MTSIGISLTLLVIIILSYSINTLAITPHSGFQLFYTSLFALIVYVYFARFSQRLKRSLHSITILLSISISTLVASTGWFSSPFVFTLYFHIIYLTLFYPAFVSILYVLCLLCIVIYTHDQGEWNIKFLTILSLLATIPISLYLRDIFLRYKEAEKKILILESSHKKYRNTVEKVLDNAVHRYSTDLRTDISVLRQLFGKYKRQKGSQKVKTNKEIEGTIERILSQISHFEKKTTGSTLVTKPHEIAEVSLIPQEIRDSL